jgi:hypothetical protein
MPNRFRRSFERFLRIAGFPAARAREKFRAGAEKRKAQGSRRLKAQLVT